MRIPLIDAVTDPQLLGASIDWRPKQLEALSLFGDDDLRLVVCAAGRQGGKSTMAVATAIWGATLRDDLDSLLPRGRTRYALIAAPTESQSRELIRVAAGMIEESPVLEALATVTADEITFRLPSGARTALRALPANPRSVRGMSASLVIADEAAHFQREDQLSNDVEMIRALEGSMNAFEAHGVGKMILISTPRGEVGEFYRLFTEARDGLLDHAAVVHAPAWLLNEALDNEEWKESKRKLLGSDAFDQEHGAEFLTAASAFLDLRNVEFADGPARPEDGRRWIAALDPGFARDQFGVAVLGESVHEPGVLVLGACEGISPGKRLLSLERRRAREDRVLDEVWQLIAPYQPRVISDVHMGDAIQSHFGRRGLSVQIVESVGAPAGAGFHVAAGEADGWLVEVVEAHDAARAVASSARHRLGADPARSFRGDSLRYRRGFVLGRLGSSWRDGRTASGSPGLVRLRHRLATVRRAERPRAARAGPPARSGRRRKFGTDATSRLASRAA